MAASSLLLRLLLRRFSSSCKRNSSIQQSVSIGGHRRRRRDEWRLVGSAGTELLLDGRERVAVRVLQGPSDLFLDSGHLFRNGNRMMSLQLSVRFQRHRLEAEPTDARVLTLGAQMLRVAVGRLGLQLRTMEES